MYSKRIILSRQLLKVTLRLIVFDVDEETLAKTVKDVKEQDVYMGDFR